MLFAKPGRKKRQRMHVRKGDKVVVISGQYKSNEPHEVLKVVAENGTVVVQGVNLRWKHQKRSQENPKGGRMQLEMPIPASKVLLWSDKAKGGTRTRNERIDGARVRVGKKCGTHFDGGGKADASAAEKKAAKKPAKKAAAKAGTKAASKKKADEAAEDKS